MPSFPRHIAAAEANSTSTAADQTLLTRYIMMGAGIAESGRDDTIINISVPCNEFEDVNDLAKVRSYNVDDLKAVVVRNKAWCRRLTLDAERVI